MEPVTPTKQSTSADDARKYFELDALLAAVESGAIALLRGRWILSLHKAGGRLQRRQELPPEAFWSAAELRQLAEQVITSNKSSMTDTDWGVLIVALSFRWLTAEHPDPDGFHLERVARVVCLYLGEPLDGIDRMSNITNSPLLQTFIDARLDVAIKADFALLWDFCSLHQHPKGGQRTPEETTLFKAGLGYLPVFYGHAKTVCWMQTKVPPGFAETMRALNRDRPADA